MVSLKNVSILLGIDSTNSISFGISGTNPASTDKNPNFNKPSRNPEGFAIDFDNPPIGLIERRR